MDCRMLIACGRLEMPTLLNDFKSMALGTNEIHELNKNGRVFNHSDGWGIVFGRSGKIESYKLDKPCWEDPMFDKYTDLQVDFVLLHARRASQKSPVNLSFVQPFMNGNWYFCHNGTIHDFSNTTKSDSEQLLASIIKNLKQLGEVKNSIRKTLNSLSRFTATNFILTQGITGYVATKYTRTPNYYTMKYVKTRDFVVVSSEILPSIKDEWVKTCNNSLLQLDIRNKAVSFEEIS